ncbi:MAG TPA: 5-(carboxyamino)imidazole ribonucleotide synthase [Acidimicrobiales bacterium]|nr:5-(carboxyamino)imidazole ribonucleotide synthase [Acidimicrobiales bacterium]
MSPTPRPGEASRSGSARVGIVGGGQLARMMTQPAIALSVSLEVFTDDADEATATLIRHHGLDGGDPSSWLALVDVVTFEHELLALDRVRAMEKAGLAVRPSAAVMSLSNKATQRQTLGELGFPVPDFATTSTVEDVIAFAQGHGWPVVVKLASGGYDGRGVWMVDDADGLVVVPFDGHDLVVEPRLGIEREIAVQVARRPSGDIVVYPVVETVQRDGMCREVIAPAPIAPELAAAAEQLARDLARAIELEGFLAIELFVVDGQLVVNELAPRVHNSGHYTIEGCITSQFENQLRAVLDWPLGSPQLRAPYAVMVNVVGSDAGDPTDRLADALLVDDVHIHLYGKSWRPGRKLGHVTALADGVDVARRRAHAAVRALGGLAMDA